MALTEAERREVAEELDRMSRDPARARTLAGLLAYPAFRAIHESHQAELEQAEARDVEAEAR